MSSLSLRLRNAYALRSLLVAAAVTVSAVACSDATAPKASSDTDALGAIPSNPAADPADGSTDVAADTTTTVTETSLGTAGLPIMKVLKYTEVCNGTTCTFDASVSSGFSWYRWSFGDGAWASGKTVTHTFPAGTSTASYYLRLSGGGGMSAYVAKFVVCSNGSCF
jgi:hypothetical protein